MKPPAPSRQTLRRRAARSLLKRLQVLPNPQDALDDPLLATAMADWQQGRIADFVSLKVLAGLAAAQGDGAHWVALLRAFDPGFPIEIEGSPPVLGGIGPGSLNSGQRVMVDGAPAWRKIYLAGSHCQRRMQHAYHEVLPRFRPVPFPQILREVRGKRLVAVDFALIEGLEGAPQPGLALPAARALAAIDATQVTPPDWNTHVYPDALGWARERLRDQAWQPGHSLAQKLRIPGRWRDGFAALVDRFRDPDPDLGHHLAESLKRFTARLQPMPRVFSHGDLNCTNLARNGAIIDWDSAAWRAYGSDAAYATAFHSTASDLPSLLQLSATEVERPGHELTDRFTYFTFLLHLLPQGGPGRLDAGLAQDLLATLQGLENRI